MPASLCPRLFRPQEKCGEVDVALFGAKPEAKGRAGEIESEEKSICEGKIMSFGRGDFQQPANYVTRSLSNYTVTTPMKCISMN